MKAQAHSTFCRHLRRTKTKTKPQHWGGFQAKNASKAAPVLEF